MYFSTEKFSQENENLCLEDLETLPDQQTDGYSPAYLFSDGRYLTILSYSKTEKKLKV